jgi:GT2 family glycosyltransferase
MHQLAVIILNYRTPDMTIDCLRSLAPEIDPLRHRVVIVDNDSGDGSAGRIEQAIRHHAWDPWAAVLRSPRNGGFSAGNNAGIAWIDAGSYLLLNSDTIVRPGAIAALLEALERHPDVAVAGPRLEDPDGTPQVSAFRDRTPASELIAAASTGPVTRLLRRYEVALPIRDEPSRPEWVTFAAALIRREALRQVGALDEGYFMYLEDVDWCRRARRAGWGILQWPAARIVHLRGGTAPVKRLAAERRRLPRYWYESRSRYFAKHFGVLGLPAANVCWMIGRGVSLARGLAGTRRPRARPPGAAWRDNWINWLRPL